ncbi:MAG: FtsX-like permease family protein [Anaerolineae bacterium]
MKSPLHLRSSAPLLKMGLRHALRRPLQSALLVMGVALGVAVIVAIDLANGSASRAFEIATDSVAGRATHQIVGGPTGLDEDIYRRLRVDLDMRQSAPVVEEYVTVLDLDERPLRLLGVDPFAEAPFRSYLISDGRVPIAGLTQFLAESNTVVISEDLASQYGIQTGDNLELRIGSSRQTVRVVGLLRPTDSVSRRALQGLLLTDISTAQEVLDRPGRLSHIDLITETDTPAEQETLELIEAMLPAGAAVIRAKARGDIVQQMIRAFELNLTALSLLALLVGMLLIYNTLSFSVIQRRPVLGTLRSLGVTRPQIFRLILTEAAALGVMGAALGLGLGVVLGRGAVRLITQTINDLYFVLSVQTVDVAPLTLAKGAVVGVGAALFAAGLPALEATAVPPASVLRRSDIESKARRAIPYTFAAGLALCAAATGLLWIPTRNLAVSFTALFGMIIGFALLTPAVTVVIMQGARPVMVGLAGVLGRMAPRDITRALSRTSVAIAALMVAVSVIIGVSIMIGSFRQTVADWLQTSLQADVYISPLSVAGGRIGAPMEPAIKAELASLDGVEAVEAIHDVTADAVGIGPINVVAVTGERAEERRRFAQTTLPASQIWPAMENGAVVVSEPFAYHNRLSAGNELRLRTDQGERVFPIVGVYYNYSSDRGTVLMSLDIYRQYWDDDKISSVGLYLAPGYDADAMVEKLQARFAGWQELVIQSNRDLRQSALEIFDRTFAITMALRLVATIVAFIGVLSALMALQLERARELGVLRATGMTRRQLWALTLLETGLMGITAGLLAIPTGFVLALVLIYVINLRSFGWTIQMVLQPGYFGQAMLVAVAAALLAGVYPALRASRIVPARALREE